MSPVKSPEDLSAPDVGKKDKIVVEKDEAEELPSGWTKEVKIRKTGSARKVDRFYTDPVTGYVFRSLKDVQRYLKTGKLGRLAIKPKMEGREETREITEQMSESLRQKRAPTDKSELPARASKRLSGINIDAVPPPTVSPSQPKTHHATRLAGLAVDAPPSPPDPKTRQATRLAGVTVDASVPSSSPAAPKTRQAGIKIVSPPPSDSKTRQATPLAGTQVGPSPPSQPEPKTRQAKRVSGIRDNASPPQPKTRRATQQAGIKINPPPPSPPDTRTSRQATGTRPVNSATPKENDKKSESEKITDQESSITIPPLNQESSEKQKFRNISPPVTPIEHNKQIEAGPTTSPAPEDQAPPTVVPPVNSEKQELPVFNPTISNPIPQDSYGYGSDMKPDSSTNFSMNDLWTDPCIEFAVKTLTGAIPVRDLNKVENFTAPLEVPLEELWTDPCIEFAIKTLTGAIPVGEDDHLLRRPASSTNPQGPHQFSSPDVLSKHYETGHKNKQQDSVFPTLGNNGGLQKSGKFVNGSNGQSSRSRFFQ